ncbi:MAG: Crp/Fnr family transcriptional regulator [Evtepia gabavorous]
MALRGSVPPTPCQGTITHRADQDCKGILLLLSGQLRSFLLSEEGREVTLYRVREGETCVLSSSCLMDAIVFDVLIEAIEETHVITLPVTALSPLAQQRPEIELFLYKTASERFSDIMWTMQQILFMGMDRRAAIFLWDESAQKGPVLRITHDEMARYIGSAREVVTKVLKYFAQEGIVALRRGTITILDREKLRRLTGMASVEERTPRPQK